MLGVTQCEIAEPANEGQEQGRRQRALQPAHASAVLAGRRGGAFAGILTSHRRLLAFKALVGPYRDSSQPILSWPYRFQIGFLPPLKLV